MKRLALLFLASTLALTACEKPHEPKVSHKKHLDSTPIYSFTTSGTANGDDGDSNSGNDMLYYYLMFSNPADRSCPCYTYTSPTPVSNFSSATFTRYQSMPNNISPPVNLTKSGTSDELSEKMEQEVEADVEEAINEPNAVLGEDVEDVTEPAVEAEVEAADTTEAADVEAADTNIGAESIDNSSDVGDSGGDGGGGE